MNEKGFTLVEILAVVVILGILSSIGVQAIGRQIEKSRRKAYKNFEETLSSSANNYLTNHDGENIFLGTDTTIIKAETLQDEGLLNEMVDPKSKYPCNKQKSGVIITKSFASDFNNTYNMVSCLYCVDKYGTVMYQTNNDECKTNLGW